MTKALLSHPSRQNSNPASRSLLWVRKNLFSSWSNSLLTLLCIWLIWSFLPPLLNWVFFQANWVGSTRADCTKAGACWVFIHERFGQFMYGLYPHDQRWRVNLALIIGWPLSSLCSGNLFLTVAAISPSGPSFIPWWSGG